MKAKLKGKGGIKGLFLHHGEKIAIALVGALALYFIWSSLQLPRLDDEFQADKLQSVVNATNQAITESRWPDADSPNAADVRVFKPIAKNAAEAVKAPDFSFTQLQPSVIPPTVLRTDPEVLPASDVVAVGGSGVLAFRDANTLRVQERRRQLEEEERMRQEREQQAKSVEESMEGDGRGRRGRGEEIDPLGGPIDPDHPKRRALAMGTMEGGLQLQGGERLEKTYWATVLAKVPIREQLKRYQDAFQQARGGFDPSRDFPRYMGFIVQRSEIINGQATPWQRIPLRDGQQSKPDVHGYVNDSAVAKLQQRAAAEWAMVPMEPVDSRYVDYMLTMPLPPLVGRKFESDATHPDIPLAVNAPPMEEAIVPAAEEEPAEEAAEGEDEFRFGAAEPGQVPVPGGGYTPMPGFAERDGYGADRRMMGVGGMGREGWGGGMQREFAAQVGGGSFAGPTANRTDLPSGVDYWLLRFFDFTVKPGKKYRYRVQLVLADPNYGIPSAANMLDQSVLDRRTQEQQKSKNKRPLVYRLAAVSEPSPAVGIPLDGGIRVAGAKLPSGKTPYEEPTVKLWAEAVEIDNEEGTAIHTAKDQDYVRGAVVNLRDKMFFADVNKTWRDEFDDHAINTNVTVLDIEGADSVGRDKAAPTRVLLMDAAGELSIRNETDDNLAVLQLKTIFTEDKRRRPEDEMTGPEGQFRGLMGPMRGR
jgi:hypothetical protein